MPKLTNFSGYDRDSRTFIDSPQSQTELLLQKLEKTNKNSLDAFIVEDLGITGDKIKQIKQGIYSAIAQHNRSGLLDKFYDSPKPR